VGCGLLGSNSWSQSEPVTRQARMSIGQFHD
jgi:hypothetical protein